MHIRGKMKSMMPNGITGLERVKKTGLEVNADKNKYVVMSRDQSAGRSHNTKIDKSPL